jgi:outer membrane protein assembly factor BamB
MSRLLLFAFAACAFAADPATEPAGPEWPTFRGTKRDNISPDKGLLKEWPKDGPKLLWKATDIGQGFSSMTVAAGKVFTMGVSGRKTHIYAVNAAKGGTPVWSAEIGRGGGENYEGTRCTPTYDDGLVYGLSAFGDFACVTADKGEVKWSKNLPKDFGGQHSSWQYAESPLIDGKHVIITPGGNKAFMVCLDKKTGEEVWRTDATVKLNGPKKPGPAGQAGYSSIVISNACGVKQYVQLAQGGTVGVDAATGKLLWHYDRFRPNTANIPTPIALPDDHILTMAGYGKPVALLKLSKDGDAIKVKEVWAKGRGCKHGGAIVVGDVFYSDADDSGSPYCAKWKTGEQVWSKRGGKGGGSASLAYADGHLYVRYDNGWVALVPADGDKYAEKGGFNLPDKQGHSWSHPVVIGGRLYLRNGTVLLCYDVKAK